MAPLWIRRRGATSMVSRSLVQTSRAISRASGNKQSGYWRLPASGGHVRPSDQRGRATSEPRRRPRHLTLPGQASTGTCDGNDVLACTNYPTTLEALARWVNLDWDKGCRQGLPDHAALAGHRRRAARPLFALPRIQQRDRLDPR